MRRVVSVWLPSLPADRIRRHEPGIGAPLVTVAQEGGSRILAAVDTAAAAAGLRPGMKLTEARILHPGLVERPADPAGDETALHRLAAWCLRYAPLAAPDPPDGLWIDVTGSTHLLGGEATLLRDLVHRLTSQGLAARAALADTPGMAHAVARYAGAGLDARYADAGLDARYADAGLDARYADAGVDALCAGRPADPIGATHVVPPGAWPIDAFPIEALRLPSEACFALRRVGVLHVHQLARLPRGPVARRFGKRVGLRLDQASGRIFEPIRPIVPHAAIQSRLGFIEPLLTAEAFTAVIGRLVAEVCAALQAAGQGARRLDLLFERLDGSVQSLRIGAARPVRDAAHLARLLTERLESVDPGLGVEAMRLIVSASDRLEHFQPDWKCSSSSFASRFTRPVNASVSSQARSALEAEQAASSLFEPASADLTPLLDRLANRLGPARLYRIEPVATHVPERSLRPVAAISVVQDGWPLCVPRPVRLLHPPQPVEAMAALPDAPPAVFTWRRVRHRVRHAVGPERIGPEWWRDQPDTLMPRDYFQVEDEDGRRFWLFRWLGAPAPSWFLHGLF